MAKQAPRAPLSVYMLADHLDAVLAAGEDLATRGADWRALAETPGLTEDYIAAEREIAEDVRTYELTVIARTLKARDHARALAIADERFAQVANLFASGTAILLDAAEECGDATHEDFDTADGLIAYIRGRGLIAPDAAAVPAPAQFAIDDNFLIAKRLGLGPMMDMAAAFLDALDAHYDLFEDEDSHPISAPAERKELGKREPVTVN